MHFDPRKYVYALQGALRDRRSFKKISGKRISGIKNGKQRVFAVAFILIGMFIGVATTTRLHLLPFSDAADLAREGRLPSDPASPINQPFVKIAAEVTPSVVNISTTRMVTSGGENSPLQPFFEDPFFKRFFGEPSEPSLPRQHKEQSLGSGVIVDPRGYVITNDHVVSKAKEIKVVLSDRREFNGKVIGSDPKTDIAVVKIDGKDLPVMPWGDSQQLKVGEYVLAVGNPFGLNQTVTMGIVSAIGRANIGIADYEDFIQTDAAINPGNSGGALVSISGHLIGINTAIFSQSGGYMGIGFAVPSNMAKSVMDSLIRTGKVVRGWLGVSIQQVTPALAKEFNVSEARGALISDVLVGSPAERGGLKRGDVILSINGDPIDDVGQLRNQVAAGQIGSKVQLKVVRDRKEITVDVTIGEQPKEIAASENLIEGKAVNALSGLAVKDITPQMAKQYNLPLSLSGVIVNQVAPGSPADEAGIQQGDVILEVNRKPVHDTKQYAREASKLKRSESVLLLVSRQGQTIFVTIESS